MPSYVPPKKRAKGFDPADEAAALAAEYAARQARENAGATAAEWEARSKAGQGYLRTDTPQDVANRIFANPQGISSGINPTIDFDTIAKMFPDETAALDAAFQQAVDTPTGGGGSGYDLQGVLAAIADRYMQHLATLDQSKADRGAAIASAGTQAQTAIQTQADSNAAQQAQVNADIRNRFATVQAQRDAEAQAARDQMARFGIDPNTVAPSLAQANNRFGQLAATQQSLGDRIASISADSFRDRLSRVAATTQAGTNTLENNYFQLKAALQQKQADEEGSARAAAARAASSGSGGSVDPLEQEYKQLRNEQLRQKILKGDTSASDAFDPSLYADDPAAYIAAAQSSSLPQANKNLYQLYLDETISPEEYQQAINTLGTKKAATTSSVNYNPVRDALAAARKKQAAYSNTLR